MGVVRLSRKKLSWIISELRFLLHSRGGEPLIPKLFAPLTLVLLVLALIVLAISVIDLANQRPLSFRLIERVTVAPIKDWNWFRSALPKPVASKSLLNLKNADINVELLGIMIGDEVSAATLTTSGKPENVYQIGDEIKPGVSITGIEPHRIIIDQNGSPRQISLKKPDSIIESLDRTEPDSLGKSMQAGFKLANMFGAVPVRLDNSSGSYASGFKLNELSDEIRSLADIENGDVIVKVSDSGIQELLKNPTALINYSSQTSLPVTVIRDGREVVVYVNAASLSAKMLPNLGQIR
ncbi:MAG: hypothetical protein CMK30_07830 [Porticoccaceae bacterium]|nr:hypothetical protein [Porticoccaceae bacterium]